MSSAVRAEQAVASDDFVESVGISGHFESTGTPYVERFDEVKSLLLEAGFRYLRTGLLGTSRTTPDGKMELVPPAHMRALARAGVH